MRKQEKKIINKKRKITFVVILAAFLVVGYATFAQPLAYNNAIKIFKKVTEIFDTNDKNTDNDKSTDNNKNNGEQKSSNIAGNNVGNNSSLDDITSTTPEKWNIKFTNAVKSAVCGNAREISPVNFDALSISFNVVLTGSGDSISYDFTITNDGIFNTKIDEIIVVPENNDNSVIAYDISGIELGDKLAPNEDLDMKVKIYYNDKLDKDIKYYNDTLKVVVNFAQD